MLRDQKTKKKLAEPIRNAWKEHSAWNKSCKEKAVRLGWVYYHEDSKKYSAVPLPNSGLTRKHFPNNAKAADIIQAINNIFFPDSNGKFG